MDNIKFSATVSIPEATFGMFASTKLNSATGDINFYDPESDKSLIRFSGLQNGKYTKVEFDGTAANIKGEKGLGLIKENVPELYEALKQYVDLETLSVKKGDVSKTTAQAKPEQEVFNLTKQVNITGKDFGELLHGGFTETGGFSGVAKAAPAPQNIKVEDFKLNGNITIHYKGKPVLEFNGYKSNKDDLGQFNEVKITGTKEEYLAAMAQLHTVAPKAHEAVSNALKGTDLYITPGQAHTVTKLTEQANNPNASYDSMVAIDQITGLAAQLEGKAPRNEAMLKDITERERAFAKNLNNPEILDIIKNNPNLGKLAKDAMMKIFDANDQRDDKTVLEAEKQLESAFKRKTGRTIDL